MSYTVLCFCREVVAIEARSDVMQNLLLELRRGTLTLSVLSQLQEPQYGYSLLQKLAEKGIGIEQNTLYPLLRRLEQQGLLTSDWSIEESRPRRYYVLSDLGRQALRAVVDEWRHMTRLIDDLLNDMEV